MNNRILFAAGREARIQWQHPNGNWYTTNSYDLEEWNNERHRIHPGDTALQYGPISTALREAAQAAEVPGRPCLGWFEDSCRDAAAVLMNSFVEARMTKEDMGSLRRELFLLFVAEYLADEGM